MEQQAELRQQTATRQRERHQRAFDLQRRWLWRILGYAALVLSVIVIGLPIYWMLIASL